MKEKKKRKAIIKFDNSSYTDTYTHIPGFLKTGFKQKKKKKKKSTHSTTWQFNTIKSPSKVD